MGAPSAELQGIITKPLEAKTDTIESAASDISGFGFTAALLAQANRALLTVATDAIRYTYDGTLTPTATVGHHLAVDKTVEILGNEAINNLKLIRVTNDAVATITIEE